MFGRLAISTIVMTATVGAALADPLSDLLGKGGGRIRQIGEAARRELAEAFGRKVHLFLHVKVNPRWEEDRGLYREIGLDWVE